MSRMAQRRIQKAGLSIPLVRGRAESLPFGTAVFDSILATFPAPFIVLPETLTALHRVLRPGGRLVIVPEARLTGGGVFRPFIEFLFTITGQRQAPDIDHSPSAFWLRTQQRFETAGFTVEIEQVKQEKSIVTVLVAQKAVAGTMTVMRQEVVITEQEKGPAVSQEQPATISEQTLLFLVTAGIIIFDHLTKLYIEIWLPLHTSYQPWPEYGRLFQLTHVTNTGAAFGLFPTGSNLFMLVALLVAGIIILYNYRLPTGHILFRVALGLQLGGALGNLIDRIRLGHVTDFLDFGPFPVFNVADASIVAGVLVLVFLMLTERQEQPEEAPARSVLERPVLAAKELPTAEPNPQPDPPDMRWND
jgi:signal peptidase II